MPLIIAALLIVVTTFRHEGAHALMAWLQGVEIMEMRLWPGYREDIGFYFGYVMRGEGGTWLVDAAPFWAALLWCGIAYLILRRVKLSKTSRILALVVGIVSPLVDLLYNYQGGFWREGTDVADLFLALPDPVVHVYFLCAIALCGGSLYGLHQRQGETINV